MGDHQQPPPSFIVQRYYFHTRVQKEGQSIADFVAQLRKLSEYCRFDATLDDMLHNRIVCGCRDKRLQCKLLAESELSFAQHLQQPRRRRRPTMSLHPNHQRVHHFTIDRVKCLGSQSLVCRRSALGAVPTIRLTLASVRRSIATTVARRDTSLAFVALKHGPRGRRNHLTLLIRSMSKCTNHKSMACGTRLQITLQVSKADILMEVDTGAALSIISAETYRRVWS